MKAATITHESRASLIELGFLALMTALGLQMLRLLITGLIFYLKDAEDVSTIAVGGIGLGVFLIAFLAPVVRRAAGLRNALLLSAGGLGVVRLVEQFTSSPQVDLVLAMAGTGLFLWSIPLTFAYLSRGTAEGGGLWGLGLLLGISLETGVKGVYRTLDLSWQTGTGADVVAVILVVAQISLLWALVRAGPRPEPASPRLARAMPMLALGPLLVAELFLFQNIGHQTVLTGWPQPAVFAWIMAANLAAPLLVVVLGSRALPPAASVLMGALLVLALIGEQTGGLAVVIIFFGHLALALLFVHIARSMASSSDGRSTWGIPVASGAGMFIFLLLIFLYSASFDIDVLVPRWVILPVVAGIVALAGASAPTPRPVRWSVAPAKWAVGLSVPLMILPLIFFLSWSEPEVAEGSGFPVRVMSYNIHQGYDIDGRLDMEALARVIEEEAPDVLALQEVARGWVIEGSVDMLVWLSQRLGMRYIWGPSSDSVWGNAVLSRYPIIRAETHDMPNNSDIRLNRGFISLVIDLGGGSRLRILATHLHAGTEEGFHRVPQVQAILEQWDEAKATVILGDLNARPPDEEMEILREAGFLDSFIASGAPGEGFTSRPDDPVQRIDYIWMTTDLKARDFSIPQSRASDHFPIAVTLYE